MQSVFKASCRAKPSGLFVHAFRSVRFAKQNVFRASSVKHCIHCFDRKECICLIRCRWLRVCFWWQVPSWRSVCVLYSLYCVLILPDAGEAAKARCGRELVADLEFVCGDRGFYRGKPGAARSGGPRSRGKGIVEQCCVRGCDLQHLESYCAKPKRVQRDVPASLQQTLEDQFWLVFLRQYQKHAEMNRDEEAASERLRERMLYRWHSRDSVLLTNPPPNTTASFH
ncbi:insulin-like growth factor I isoform X1 [Cyprinus carpio]|uniref:Insulin-like growth factor I isoform X1 n=1 Tax=Cyprinus carpio TaxID=7962 RepID=A0A9Q9YCQ0_CYPCA|nr:insulin-like growth factor I isoform X1 [Cyprinus carpio]